MRRGPRVAWPLSASSLKRRTIASAASLYFAAFFMHVDERVMVAARDAPPLTGAAAEVVAAALTTQPTLMIVSPHFFQTSVRICAKPSHLCAFADGAAEVCTNRINRPASTIAF